VISRQDASARGGTGHGASTDGGRDGDRIEPTISGSNSGKSAQHSDSAEYQDDLDDAYEGEDYEEDDHPYDEELDNDRDYGRDVEDHSRDEGEDDYTEDYDDDDEDDDEDYEDSDTESDEDYVAPSQSATSAQLQSDPEEVLIINVMAHKGSMFNGSQLLDTLLQCGMRYGDMDIFHRYTDVKGEGALLFSMANMVKPGTFDLDAMDEFVTPGVSLFMTLPLKADSMQSFELMLDTAKTLVESLQGEMKDEQRSVMTRQTIEHCRQRILDFERRRLFQRPR
jgi:cell division protein ZipA